jgi:hypothetical protein
MGDFVWISHVPSDPTLADGSLKSDLQSDGDERVVTLAEVARNGGVVAEADLPSEFWGEVGEYRAHRFPNEWPDISYYVGLWLVSARVADVLRVFDMGRGSLRPLRLFGRDHMTPVPGEWFCWNVGNVKDAFLPQASSHIRPAPGRKWRTLGAVDHDLKCSTAATVGPDAWIDPTLRGVLFLSAGLGQALIDAALANERAGFGELLKVDVIRPEPRP